MVPHSKRAPQWWARIVGGLGRFAKGGRYAVLHGRGREEEEEDTNGGTSAFASAHSIPTDAMDWSPANPYLVPPGQSARARNQRRKPRGSGEWAEEHRAFFLSSSREASEQHSRASSATDSLSESELDDIEAEAREAQGRRPSLGRKLRYHSGYGEAGTSWVDLSLAMIDGAMDRAAARIVRWADDNGGDEALVLPIVKGKTD